jgi:YVTN family beta-propeller protein
MAEYCHAYLKFRPTPDGSLNEVTQLVHERLGPLVSASYHLDFLHFKPIWSLVLPTFTHSMKGLTMTHSSNSHLRRLALTITCVLLLFISLSGAMNTTHAQTRAYVANTCNNSLSVIDVATNTVIASITVAGPAGVAITPDGTKAYVTNAFSNTVSVIDTASNIVIDAIPVGVDPINLAITPDGTLAYVVNEISNTVSVIDRVTNTVIANIPVGLGPSDITITPDGTRAYVNNHTSNTVSVIDTSTNSVTAAIPLCCAPFGIAAIPDDTRAYVTTK